MRTPTPLPPAHKPQPLDRRRNLALAWVMVGAVFVLGACCGGTAVGVSFLSSLSNQELP